MKKLFRMLLIVFAAWMFVSVTGTANANERVSKEITLIEDGELIRFRTFADTVEDLYRERGITLSMGDKSSHEQSDIISNGMQIKLNRGFFVTVVTDGASERIKTSHDTLAGHLIARLERERGITYVYEGSLTSPLQKDDTIELSTQKEETFTITDILPFETETIETDDLNLGIEKTVQEGAFGEKQTVLVASFQSGEEISREILNETITREPVNQIIHIGTYVEPEPEVIETSGGSFSYSREIQMSASAYSADYACTGKNPGDRGYGITASGVPCRPGIVAVDPRIIPLGTRLFVEGYGEALAADTGSAIRGNRIDLYYENYSDALSYGRKSITVYVLD